MCGRFALFAAGDELAERFRLSEAPLLDARYNLAPTQKIAAMRAADGGGELVFLRWGLIPSWAKDAAIGNKLLNARCETVADKPSFRSAFRQRRCLIPASGFYEWKKESAQRKQPYFIHARDGGVLAFAGLWEQWHDPSGNRLETCTILTTQANELMRPLHERMPVIVDPSADDLWLNSSASAEALSELFASYPSERMAAYPVGSWVSNPRHEGPRCLESTD